MPKGVHISLRLGASGPVAGAAALTLALSCEGGGIGFFNSKQPKNSFQKTSREGDKRLDLRR